MTVELSDQNPKRRLNEDRMSVTFKADVGIDKIVEMIYSGLLVACIVDTSDKSF